MQREEKDAIEFLNTKIADVFKTTIFKNVNVMRFKKNLLTSMNEIENVMTGTFHSGLFIKDVVPNRLVELFPNGMRLFNYNTIHAGHFLDTARDCLAHAFISKKDFTFLNYCYKELDNEPKLDKRIRYTSNNRLSVAGFVFLIMNFLREQSVDALIKKDVLFSLVATGKFKRGDCSYFVNIISRVDLEKYEIRRTLGSDLQTSVLGEYKDCLRNNEFKLVFGAPNNPLYHVVGKFFDSTITIKKGSLTSTYYEDDFLLNISFIKGFIEMSNQLPELMLVDVLKELGLSSFDQKTYDLLSNRWNIIQKLNYPKYYIDKNVKTLTIPNTMADYRAVNSLINNAVSSICISLESFVYKVYKIRVVDYSRFRTALQTIINDDGILNEMVVLRNFAMHGKAWGTINVVNKEAVVYTPSFVFKALQELLNYLKVKDYRAYDYVKNEIESQLIKKLCNYRYTQVNKHSIDFLNGNCDLEQLDKAILYVSRSMFDTNDLNELNALCNSTTYEYKIDIVPKNMVLYLEATDESLKTLEIFCKNNSFNIKVNKAQVLTTITIK